MISLKSPREIRAMEKSGAVLAGMHLGIQKIIRPGISSWVSKNLPVITSSKRGRSPLKSALKGTSTQPA